MSFDKLMRRGYNESIVQAYHKYMTKIAIAFGAEEERAQREMRDVIDLDIAITRVSQKKLFYIITKSFFCYSVL